MTSSTMFDSSKVETTTLLFVVVAIVVVFGSSRRRRQRLILGETTRVVFHAGGECNDGRWMNDRGACGGAKKDPCDTQLPVSFVRSFVRSNLLVTLLRFVVFVCVVDG